MNMVSIKYRNIITGCIYEKAELLDKTGLRMRIELSRDKVIGYRYI